MSSFYAVLKELATRAERVVVRDYNQFLKGSFIDYNYFKSKTKKASIEEDGSKSYQKLAKDNWR